MGRLATRPSLTFDHHRVHQDGRVNAVEGPAAPIGHPLEHLVSARSGCPRLSPTLSSTPPASGSATCRSLSSGYSNRPGGLTPGWPGRALEACESRGATDPADVAQRSIGQGVVETADILARHPRDGD